MGGCVLAHNWTDHAMQGKCTCIKVHFHDASSNKFKYFAFFAAGKGSIHLTNDNLKEKAI
jgi:hypothetical protein